MVAYLTKSDANEGFNQIIDFLNGSIIKYALTVNPNIYVSCIKQFWTTVAVKKVNDVIRLQALVNKKKVVLGKECRQSFQMLHVSLFSPVDDEKTTQEVREGVPDAEHDEGVPAAGDVAKGDVSAAHDEVLIVAEEPSIPSPTPPTPPPQPSQKVPSTSQVPTTSPQSPQERMITDMDANADVVLKEAKEVVDDAKDGHSVDVQGRTAESQVEIYKIDLDHANKVLSMQEDETKAAKVQEVVEVVTTSKVTAASSRRRKEVVIRDLEESSPSTIIPDETKSKDKGKGILVEEPKPLKKQAHIEQDEKYAKELEAEKPQTKGQTRKNMMVYLKNVASFKMDYFKGMSYDDIRPIFEAKFNTNVAFLQKTKEQIEEEESRALKRPNETPTEKETKRQKLDEEVEELKRHLQIMPNKDDDVYTEATLLARKVPVVGYEIINQNNRPYYKIIRDDARNTCLNLEESKEFTWSSKSQGLEAVGIMWCADHYFYNQTTDFVSKEEVPTHKVYSGSNAECYEAGFINERPSKYHLSKAAINNASGIF
nr:hypothetical protein [Tanacetum cinerariifolium]